MIKESDNRFVIEENAGLKRKQKSMKKLAHMYLEDQVDSLKRHAEASGRILNGGDDGVEECRPDLDTVLTGLSSLVQRAAAGRLRVIITLDGTYSFI